MNGSNPPIVICYYGSPGAARAIDAAGPLFPAARRWKQFDARVRDC
jgi:hypothetical protein